MIKSRCVLSLLSLLSNKQERSTFTGDKALTQVVLGRAAHIATSTYLKRNSNPHTGRGPLEKGLLMIKEEKQRLKQKHALRLTWLSL